ncbi:ankyrin repeat domain-containing protein [Tuwongella immobilis]|uniref:Uncharacterized protein n=1 Tax=Tuwongella immobilis TaxID=692036 RepID=A0A6C2YUJ6_9BACT|nr:ankyrin repeat domain-containing protein [Tuwongella immobilis]VIP05061.1 ankyrin : Ankyrin domain protein OS=Blastopirellula marina DSM 3645 GN=DSM3645_04755 PE=4 SV=1: Ank_4: Ank_2 [Tuwongella immobilis]VTS07478.1 ankyrin : Ankyrin domain protein OS=Blastopirellula marina DSM 3645 GN=DSM3645_04755 PE=4 SV=1: Ank_4: Ank_2 [Tuwongella immobilis]
MKSLAFWTMCLLGSGSWVVAAEPIALTAETRVKLQTIAFQAAREGDVATLREYLAVKMPLNETNSRGDTLLIVAAYQGQASAVEWLLKQPGIEIDRRNRMGLTALTAATFKGEVGIAKQLLAAKADVNLANGTGQTALMFAALAGRTEMVKLLLDSGAQAGARDRLGNTPLTLAQSQGATEIVALLQAHLTR